MPSKCSASRLRREVWRHYLAGVLDLNTFAAFAIRAMAVRASGRA
jgi:hypothetical protein